MKLVRLNNIWNDFNRSLDRVSTAVVYGYERDGDIHPITLIPHLMPHAGRLQRFDM